MDDTIKDIPSDPKPSTPASKPVEQIPIPPMPTERQPKAWRAWMAVFGTLFTIAAWILLPFVSMPSLVCAVVGVIVSALGIGSRLRTLAITTLLASSVLCMVYAIFYGVIYFVLNKL